MVTKLLKYGAILSGGAAVVGAVFFGGDLISYVRSSARSVQTAVKGSVPIEFELQRARDLIEDIIPELQANIRLIAQEEVEIASLDREIENGEQSLDEQGGRIARIRQDLRIRQAAYSYGDLRFTREQVMQDLARRFDYYKQSQDALAGRHRLLEARQKSLQGAMQMLDRTRIQKVQLEQQIEALAGQHRLVQAASVGSRIAVDGSKLTQTQKLIEQIRKRLHVAERVLAHEAHFVETIHSTISKPCSIITVSMPFPSSTWRERSSAWCAGRPSRKHTANGPTGPSCKSVV